MAKISDIEIPKLLFDEGAAPATPAATNVALYAKADGLLYSKDDAGSETLVSGGAGGGGGGEFTEQSTVKLTSGNLTTTSTTFVDVTGLTVTMTTAAVRCLVMFSGIGNNDNIAQTAFDLAIDGTRQGQTLGLSFLGGGGTTFSNAGFTYLTDVLTAASHTFKIQWKVAGNTGTLYASTTHTPAILTVIETSMAT